MSGRNHAMVADYLAMPSTSCQLPAAHYFHQYFDGLLATRAIVLGQTAPTPEEWPDADRQESLNAMCFDEAARRASRERAPRDATHSRY